MRPHKWYLMLSWMRGHIWHLRSSCNDRKIHGSPGAVERFIFSQGMISHQCGEWRMFILLKGESPPLVIKHRSPSWQAIIIASIIWHNQFKYQIKISIKYTIHYSKIIFLAPSQKNYRDNYCAQVRSNLVQRESCVQNSKLFVVLSVM